MTWLMHVANGLYLASYAVRDILWLRVITCIANLALLAMFALAPAPPTDAIAWQAVFLLINLTRLVQRRSVSFSMWMISHAPCC